MTGHFHPGWDEESCLLIWWRAAACLVEIEKNINANNPSLHQKNSHHAPLCLVVKTKVTDVMVTTKTLRPPQRETVSLVWRFQTCYSGRTTDSLVVCWRDLLPWDSSFVLVAIHRSPAIYALAWEEVLVQIQVAVKIIPNGSFCHFPKSFRYSLLMKYFLLTAVGETLALCDLTKNRCCCSTADSQHIMVTFSDTLLTRQQRGKCGINGKCQVL